jgi:diguanylate cyclase (GGDEF)-like protein
LVISSDSSESSRIRRLLEPMRRLFNHQNPHSFFIAGASLLLAMTLVIDFVFDWVLVSTWIVVTLIGMCLAFFATALIYGRTFPQWAGLVGTAIFFAVTLFYIGPLNDAQAAIASAQELPIISLYLGWFLRPVIGRILMTLAALALAVVVASNPVFHAGGELGLPTAVQMFIVMAFCFEIGSFLWRESRRRVVTDQLTGALNRDGFLEHLDRELTNIQRSGVPLCLVVIDFDYFKRLNDSQGHAAGDAALADTTRYFKKQLRANDALGRTGGDEFAIMLSRSDATTAQQVMRRLRAGSPHAWSWGIAQARPQDRAETLFERADDQLYRQKRSRDAAL